MEYIINKISALFFKDDSKYGYVLQKSDNKQLVLLKKQDKFWKTEWLDDSVVITKPEKDITNIFVGSHL
jgi:hypothetical protein